MKLFIRLESKDYPEKFPVYQVQLQEGASYEPVVDETPDYDPQTHRLGSYARPKKVIGDDNIPYFRTERELIKLTFEEIELRDSELLQEARQERNRYLSEADIDVLRLIEDMVLPDDEPLKILRQQFRDVTDPKKNGGAKTPKDIMAKVQSWQK